MTAIAALGFVALSFATMDAAVAQSNNSSLFNNSLGNMPLPPAKLDLNIVPSQPRPKVGLVKCSNTGGLACNAPFCLKVRTKAWDQLPSGLTETPEVYIRFTRQIRSHDGQALPSNRFKVALPPGSHHEQSLWFKVDDGPLFFDTRVVASLTYPASLQNASPEDVPFDIDLTELKVAYPLTGDSCEKSNWYLPSWW